MSTLEKMQVLADSAQYDLCDYVSHSKSSQVNLPGIYHATGHNGCKIPLFKTLMTNKCKNESIPALLQQRLCQWTFFKFRNWRYNRQHYGKDHRDCKDTKKRLWI